MSDLTVHAQTPHFNMLVVGSSRSTSVAETPDEKFALLKAVSDPAPADELIGKEFNLLDFIQNVTEMTNEQTGEMATVCQSVIITNLGAFRLSSNTAARDLDRILTVMGPPSQIDKKFKFVLRQEKSSTSALNKFYTIKPV